MIFLAFMYGVMAIFTIVAMSTHKDITEEISEEYSRKTNPLCLLLDHELVIKGEL